VASHGVLEKLELPQIFTRLPLVTNVSFNNLPASAFTDSRNVVVVRPKLPTPQRLLHTRLTPENLPRSDTLEHSHYVARCYLRMRRTQQVDVISVTSNLLKLNFVPLAYFTRCLDYDSLNLIIQQRPPVFHRKHNVVMYLPRAMARFMNNRDTFHPSILNPKPIPVASHGESQVEFMAERGLVLSPEKTKITHIEDGFDFLGWNIRKYSGKLLMKPSKANVKAHLDKIREVIKGNKTAKQANLIKLLNPVLRGWANYHSHVVAKKTFARVDDNVWSMLWRWAARRHPEKGARWVKDKYFKSKGTRNWVFAATEKEEDGTSKEFILLKESDTPIKRHIKIKAAANPHAPQWEPYFESRWGKKMLYSTRGRRKLYRVWQRQDGLCVQPARGRSHGETLGRLAI
jgi:hypothetical protein